jgi:hypothetical protein
VIGDAVDRRVDAIDNLHGRIQSAVVDAITAGQERAVDIEEVSVGIHPAKAV